MQVGDGGGAGAANPPPARPQYDCLGGESSDVPAPAAPGAVTRGVREARWCPSRERPPPVSPVWL